MKEMAPRQREESNEELIEVPRRRSHGAAAGPFEELPETCLFSGL